MQNLGYVYGSTGDDRQRLMQQQHVIELRSLYLQKINKLRAEGYLVFYLDETWVNKNHSPKKDWALPKGAEKKADQPEVLRPGGKKKPTGKGARAIVVGVGSCVTGVIPELLRVFKGAKGKDTDDYHKEMNADFFEEWMQDTLAYINAKFPGQKCAIVYDNASYHSRLTDETRRPNATWKKAELIDWMRDRKCVPPELLPGFLTPDQVQQKLFDSLKNENLVPFSYVQPCHDSTQPAPSVETYNTLTKAKLLSAVPNIQKKYVVDEMCRKHGVVPLRLPPYWCEFNPIELVWARAKGEVARKNLTYNMKSVMKLMRSESVAVDAAQWMKCEQHAMKRETQAIAGDYILLAHVLRAANETNDRAGEFIINFIVSGSEESDDDSDDSDAKSSDAEPIGDGHGDTVVSSC
jgi:hypothetical protein